MKKNKLFAVLVSILMFATVFMSGCAFFKGANKLELTEMPKSTYTLTQNWKADEASLKAAGFSFSIKLTKDKEVTTYVFGKTAGDNEVQLTYKDGGFKVGDLKIFELVDFDLSKAGKYTAKIKGEGAICTFVYTVKTTGEKDGFAAGSGVEGDPYIIETTEQFLKLDAKTNADFFGSTVKYFKLNADIDLTGKKNEGFVTFDNDTLNTVINRVQNISLDGAGHKLYNFGQDLDCVFGDITTGTATFSNLDFYLDGQNMTFFYITAKRATVTFNKTSAYGSKLNASQNTGVFTAYNRGVLSFNECKNYCNIDSTSVYVSAFVGYPMNDVALTNCVNYGDIAAEQAGAFICNAAQVNGGVKITFANCDNKGKLISITDSNMCFAVSAPDSKLLEDGKLECDKYSVDQATYNNMTNRANMVVLGKEDILSQYVEKIAFNEAGELEIKVKADKASSISKIVVKANYLPGYVNENGTVGGTLRQYITEEFTTINSDILKTVNIKNYGVKVLAKGSLADAQKAATNDNKVWSVVDGSYVIEVDQKLNDGQMLLKKFTSASDMTHLTAGETYSLNYTVFIFEGNDLVTGKSGKIADFKA